MLIRCLDCGQQISTRAEVCPYCGRPISTVPSKNRVAFVVFGLIFGCLGIHNFYVGYIGRGIAQLLISVMSLGLLCPAVAIWNIIEVCVVVNDANGMRLS